MKLINNDIYLLLIDKETEIKEYFNGYVYQPHWKRPVKLEDDVISLGYAEEDRKEYGGGKIIAYYPLTKEAKELEKLLLLPNPFENSFDITKWAKEEHKYNHRNIHELSFVLGCKVGYEKAQAKQFSLEDMEKAIQMAQEVDSDSVSSLYTKEEIIQSLSTQQLPSEFIPEYEDGCMNYTDNKICDKPCDNMFCLPKGKLELKTITNLDGKQELVGTYKY